MSSLSARLVGEPDLLTIEVRLSGPSRRALAVKYLDTQPLLPRWRLRVTVGQDSPVPEVAGGVEDSTAHVTVVGPEQREEFIPRIAGGNLVVVLDHPGEVADWHLMGCFLDVEDPWEYLSRAVDEAAHGRVWISERVTPHLVDAMAGVGSEADRVIAMEPLTHTERETLDLILEGRSNASIAANRAVEVTTVKTCVRSILRKYGVGRRQELIAAVRRGEG